MPAQLGDHKGTPLHFEKIRERHEKGEKHEYFKVFFALRVPERVFAKFANLALKKMMFPLLQKTLLFKISFYEIRNIKSQLSR
ncbi:MAG: hypothetical protein B6243_05010 [Anaerolineaceae bacterium 4572_5.2]|nr:MAG: hypothetical protein B6243_05010 [Anaerolineaceae bacterium 4572_5.2]